MTNPRLTAKAVIWLQGQDLNLRPLGYEPSELPNCSTLHQTSDAGRIGYRLTAPNFLTGNRLRGTMGALRAVPPTQSGSLWVSRSVTEFRACPSTPPRRKGPYHNGTRNQDDSGEDCRYRFFQNCAFRSGKRGYLPFRRGSCTWKHYATPRLKIAVSLVRFRPWAPFSRRSPSNR